jgi:hypothetical protein
MENWRFGETPSALGDPDLFARLARLWRDADGQLASGRGREAEGAAVVSTSPVGATSMPSSWPRRTAP